ncbi:GAF domain-containing protein [Desulfofundulus thermobenzoicus]|uniref:GAF domain-containing protein n=1 Tax=Desulfofundulus thermobenzoicus TaxID=29376 RepID=A0A6N7IPX3_9FIRM|nr:GAF domain-containing protein [Desulfofundulus thermobenzoicus]MQL51643.1 GAF domain-containing protein [Desulfofundulus thermobenzoicus]
MNTAKQTDKQLKQYHMLIHLGQELISSLDLKTVLSLITKYATELLNAHSSVLLLRDDFTKETTYVSVYNVTEQLLQKKLLSSESLGNQIIENKKPMVLNDYSRYPRRVALLEQYNIKAVVGVPIIWQEQAIGALNVHTTDPDQQFNEDDINLLMAFANYAAIAIINAKLYTKTNQELRHIRTINEISLISNSDYTINELLSWLIDKIKSLYPENDYILMVRNPLLGSINHVSSKALPPEQILQLKKFADQNIIKQLKDTQSISTIGLFCGSSNILAFPLIRKQKLLGYLFLLNDDPDKETIRIIESIATHISITLENALLHIQTSSDLKRLIDETNSLNYAIRKITESSLKEDLNEQILNLALFLTKAQKGCFFLYFPEQNCFKPNLSINMPEIVKCKLSQSLAEFYNLFSMSKILMPNQINLSEFSMLTMLTKDNGLINPYILPLIFQDQLIGALVIDTEQGHIPSNNLVIMQIFMDIAAIVMKNAELYQNEKRTVKELRNFSQQLLETQKLLENAFNIHNELLHQVLNNNTINEIASTVHQHTGCPLLIEDGAGNVLAEYPNQHGFDTIYDKRNDPEFIDFYHELMEKKTPLSHHETEDIMRHTVPLIAGDKIVGFLSIFAGTHGFTLLQKHIAESSALAFSLAIANANRALEVEQSLKGEILEALIDEKYQQRKDDLLYRANYLGLSNDTNYRLLIIDYSDDRHSRPPVDGDPAEPIFLEKRLIAESLAAVSHKMPAKFIFMNSPEGIVLAYPSGEHSREEIARLLSLFMDDFYSRYTKKYSFVVGVSTLLTDLLDFRKGFLEACQCITIARLYKHLNKPLYFDDTGLLGFLFHEENRQLLTTFVTNQIGPLIRHDKTNNLCLVDTLECYLDNNCNLADTAGKLYIHVNTLKYRLKKIKELTSIDLGRTDHRVNMYAACKMYRILLQNNSINAL